MRKVTHIQGGEPVKIKSTDTSVWITVVDRKIKLPGIIECKRILKSTNGSQSIKLSNFQNIKEN